MHLDTASIPKMHYVSKPTWAIGLTLVRDSSTNLQVAKILTFGTS